MYSFLSLSTRATSSLDRRSPLTSPGITEGFSCSSSRSLRNFRTSTSSSVTRAETEFFCSCRAEAEDSAVALSLCGCVWQGRVRGCVCVWQGIMRGCVCVAGESEGVCVCVAGDSEGVCVGGRGL